MLGLSGNELLTFAIIYNFSKDKSSSFRGSQGYLSECIGCSRQSVNNCLKSLVGKKYIDKETRIENNIELSSYRVNYQIIDMFDGDIDDEKVDLSKLDTLSKNLTPPVKKLYTIVKMIINIIIICIIILLSIRLSTNTTSKKK